MGKSGQVQNLGISAEDAEERRIRVYTGSVKSKQTSNSAASGSDTDGRSSEKSKRGKDRTRSNHRKSMTHQEVIKEEDNEDDIQDHLVQLRPSHEDEE